MMDHWEKYSAWRERRRELLREAQERALARERRKARAAFAPWDKGSETVEVRWGVPEDEAEVAELLELNGMPRWVAFEERFVVAERDGAILAAVRYRTQPKRLLLGLLIADPCAGKRRLAVDLYEGARGLALELGASDIVAKVDPRLAGYPHKAGYHRWGGGWRMDLSRPVERHGKLPAGGWRRIIALVGAFLTKYFPRAQERPRMSRTKSDTG